MQTNFDFRMKNRTLLGFLVVLVMTSCGEYNKILKSKDPEVKYEYAKKYYDAKKYGRTITLLEEIKTVYRGLSREQEILFLLGQACFNDKDYISATAYYTQYYTKYPKGEYTELSRYYAAYGLYLDSPDVRLDQTSTYKAIQGFQEFMEYYPQSEKTEDAKNYMFELQEKLAYKELLASQLYFNLGLYMGNNYESCVVTSREALKNYPFSVYSEEFQFLIVRSRFELASNSVENKKAIRYRDLMDEHFNYKNMFPTGKHLKDSEKYYREALKAIGANIDAATEEAVIQEKEQISK